MKNLLVLLILTLPMQLSAQKIVNLSAVGVQDRADWTTIATGASNSFVFHFSGRKDRNPYSGFVSVVLWADTSATAMPDSITASAHPMFYDHLSDAWEISAGKLDSLDIKDDFNVITNHGDDKYSFAVALNILGADGLQVNVYNTDSARAILVRVELRMAIGGR